MSTENASSPVASERSTSYWVDLLGAEIRYVVGRYRTRVIEAGSGTPLLLLHGTGGHAENFVRNIMPLAAHFRVLAIDFLWHGKSQTTGFEPAVIPPLVDQVLDVLDTLGLPRAHVNGQSLGGWVAMRFAIEYPDRIEKLVLTTPMGYTPVPGFLPGYAEPDLSALLESSLAVLRDPSTQNIRARLARILADPAKLTDEAVAVRKALYNDPAVNAVQRELISHYLGGEAIKRYRITDEVAARIKAPTLVFWGDKNISVPAVGRRLSEVIPDGRFVCAHNTGHWAQYEAHEMHNREVARFLDAPKDEVK